MGADIRTYVCRRSASPPPDGRMDKVARFHVARSRYLFELMSGSGADPEHQLFPPRGLPDDLPLFIDTEGMNTPSWLTAAEMEEVVARMPQEHASHLVSLVASMRALDEWCEEHDPGGQAVLVFFFHG